MTRSLVACITACLLSTPLAAEEPVALPVMRLHVDLAQTAAEAAMAACRAEGLNVAVTIVDRGGHPQVVLRDTLAMPITVDISRHKAYAAMNFNAPTSTLEDRFSSPFSPAKLPGLILSAGGLPITAASSILGGIGVSGAPSGETDEACARAGLEAIDFELQTGIQ